MKLRYVNIENWRCYATVLRKCLAECVVKSNRHNQIEKSMLNPTCTPIRLGYTGTKVVTNVLFFSSY